MFKAKLTIIFLCLISSKAISQVEVKIYSGVWDRLGLAIEYFVNENIGIELEGSFRTKTTSNFYINADVKNRENNIYINAMFKWYTSKENPYYGFFLGGYLRYWQNFQTVIDTAAWTEEQREYSIENNGWISYRSQRISFGGIIGYKFQIGKKVTISLTGGIGFSPTLCYWNEEVRVNSPEGITTRGRPPWLGLYDHVNGIGNVSIGYRFGRSRKTKAYLVLTIINSYFNFFGIANHSL